MSESNNDISPATLNLSPQEKSAFSHLFSRADNDSLGVVTGERAVSFFEQTHVPAPVLGEIWQIADTENRGLLTKAGFCIVLRLIGWYQAGQQPSQELAFKPAPLPKFDGVSLDAHGAGGQQQQATSPTAGGFPPNALQPQVSGQGAPIRVPPLDPQKLQQYSGLLERSGANNGLLDGGTAKSIFERAGLPNEVLGKIWMLSDRDQRGALDQTEFIVAMHLLTSMKTRAMTALPNVLPQGLYEAASRRGGRPPSRQPSGQPAPTAVPRQLTGQQQARTTSPLAKAPEQSTPPPLTAQTSGSPWLVSPQEKSQYDRFFATIDTSGQGIISGEQAVRFFSDSRLPEETLATIWDLADINSEGQLNRDEFSVAMYLIRQQRSQNAPPLPAFLPSALIPPSMRGQQQQQQSTAPTFDNANNSSNMSKSASEDLFGLDEMTAPQPPQPLQTSLQPQGTGASATRDPFSGSQPGSPSSPQKFQPQTTGSGMFKPFQPSSAFGASLAQQNTGGSLGSSQGQTRAPPPPQQSHPQSQSMSNGMDDLLGDNENHAEESSKITGETTELANMSSQIGNLRNQMETTQNKKATTQADLNATSNQKKALEQRLQQFRGQYETEVRAVKEMEQQLATAKDSVKKLNQEMAMLEGGYQDLATQHQTVSQQLQADQQENANLKQRISQVNAEVSRLKPELEKMKLDARQQKGMVSINKKQLATNEAERDRLQAEKGDLEREAAEQARSAAASPEPASSVASPSAGGMSSTNPFFRSAGGAASPPPTTSSGPTPSAFDSLFGPPEAFAPNGQAGSRNGTPPATSFIGRSVPGGEAGAAAAGAGVAVVGAAGVGAAAMADSQSSGSQATPAATPPVADNARESPFDAPASSEPPPPPASRQFTPTNLPLASGVAGSDAASSTKAMPPGSRGAGAETPAETPQPTTAEGLEETLPGAFPAEDQPSAQGFKSANDFDSAFAGFGDADKANEGEPAPSQAPPQQARGFSSEFPPIQTLEQDDDSSESDSNVSSTAPRESGFDDDFGSAAQTGGAANLAAATSPPPGEPTTRIASGADIAAVRPSAVSNESTASNLPSASSQPPPPSYEQSDNPAHGGSGERSVSNQFPAEYGSLLPARDDPTSPGPPVSTPPTQTAEPEAAGQTSPRVRSPSGPPMTYPEDEIRPAPLPAHMRPPPPAASASPPLTQTLSQGQSGAPALAQPPTQSQTLAPQATTPSSTDVFHDASSRPVSEALATPERQTTLPPASAPAAAAPQQQPPQPKDDFADFDDLTDAQDADATTHSGSDFDFGFSGAGASNAHAPAFDSTFDSGSGAGTPKGPPLSGSTSTLPPSAAGQQQDWDAIFSGLDSSKEVDTQLQTPETPASAADPWAAPPVSKGGASAVTPGTEHDDPILKRLTGMGYQRAEALGALERFDYDINKAVDHLAGS